ncbi:MAG: 4-hydroxy-3-methylbut-2-enyl diphosphate reductase, partial [Pseudomonadota bacterium]|nr:4-hydroxy-3-methylbut-2-enyl diphosphate reductase [Pseudomonadota bacterium]
MSATVDPLPADDLGLVVLAPLSIEAWAVRGGAPWARVHQIGMGPRRAARSAHLAGDAAGGAVLIAGFCG